MPNVLKAAGQEGYPRQLETFLTEQLEDKGSTHCEKLRRKKDRCESKVMIPLLMN
jgi:hypothetical protein